MLQEPFYSWDSLSPVRVVGSILVSSFAPTNVYYIAPNFLVSDIATQFFPQLIIWIKIWWSGVKCYLTWKSFPGPWFTNKDMKVHYGMLSYNMGSKWQSGLTCTSSESFPNGLSFILHHCYQLVPCHRLLPEAWIIPG